MKISWLRKLKIFWLFNYMHTKYKLVVQSLSHVWLFKIPWTAAHQASLSFTISWSLLKLMSIESMILSNYLILCQHLLLLSSILQRIRVFSNGLILPISWPNYWTFSIRPSSEYSGLTSFRIDWIYVLDVQWILKSLLQHHSLKASVLLCIAFFIVQLSHPYMTTGKNHSFDYTDLCWQINVSAFKYTV